MIERFEIINTPKHGSWLNMAEIESSTFAVSNRRIEEIETIKKEKTGIEQNIETQKMYSQLAIYYK